MTVDTRAPTSREVKKAERRAELLAAAATLFADRGFAGVRLEDLGAAVGITVGNVTGTPRGDRFRVTPTPGGVRARLRF